MVLLAAGVPAGGCSRAPASTDVALSFVRVAHGPRGEQVPPAQIEAAIDGALSRSARFSRVAPGEEGAAATLWFHVTSTGGGARQVDLSLTVEGAVMAAVDGRTQAPALEATVRVTTDANDEGAVVTDALALALGILDARVALAAGEEGRVPALLASEDGQLVLLALAFVREHPSRAWLEGVQVALGHDDPDVALAAMETLGIVGGPAQVPAILARAPLLQMASAFRLYETLGRLGGAQAVSFLTFAHRNEEDPSLRAAAGRALQSARQVPADGRDARSQALVSRGHWKRP